MKKIAFILLLLITFSISAMAEIEKKDFKLPNELKKTYGKFIVAMKTGDAGTINKYCLPHAVSFTYEKREITPNYGKDINMPWAKNGFSGEIFSVRKDGEGCYLIRTATTAMWFIHTKSMGWRLYGYLDKPIM